jgi:lysophospholipase L1-like esterase
MLQRGLLPALLLCLWGLTAGRADAVTTVYPAHAPGIVSIGLRTTTSPWPGSTGAQIAGSAASAEVDLFFTGASVVTSQYGYFNSTTGSITATLMETDGTVLSSGSPALVTGSFARHDTDLFTGLTEGHAYWLRLVFNQSQSDVLKSDDLIALTGANPSISTPTLYGPVYTFSSTTDATDISSSVGFEGGGSLLRLFGYDGYRNANQVQFHSYPLIRFKATLSSLSLFFYNNSQFAIHVNRLPADGSSGQPLDGGATLINPGNTGGIGPWKLAYTSPDSSHEYLYELSVGNFSGGGLLLFGMMTSGGTGIDTSVAGSTLVRHLRLAAIGDSRVSQEYEMQSQVWLGSIALFGQAGNFQTLNVGVPGEALATLAGSSTRYKEITRFGAIPDYILVDAGINDIEFAKHPAIATMQGYLVTLINNIRSEAGFAMVPIYIEAIKPADTFWVPGGHAFIDPYNAGYAAIVAQCVAGTAPGLVQRPDPNVFFLDSRTWNLAGAGWETGTAFDHTNFDDGLHLNSAASSTLPGSGFALEAGYFSGAFGSSTAVDVTGRIAVSRGPFLYQRSTSTYIQVLTLTNIGATAVAVPISCLLTGLTNATLANASGTTVGTLPAGRPYVNLSAGSLASGASTSVTLSFSRFGTGSITYAVQLVAGAGSR